MPDNPEQSVKLSLKYLVIYTMIIGLLSFAIHQWVPQIHITPTYPFVLVFMFAVTFMILRLLEKSMEKRLSKFTNAFMLLNFGKLIFYTILIFVYAYLNRVDAVPFIATFFSYYMLFAGFEVYTLLKINSKKENG